ncbi:CPBP family intramembrane metalloprotease [candidate division KSB3 bacterium]|uniref:CPBP family intramembrane metalloprotease n=1 Tax=candidate division KSB3 bacterium TaxID=2044937 RepID=A0A9D5JZG9_9BACT|nr:CPBP family intramembrane metalloprotease [candidate division KSB3 bacterium]MBD3326647.1 CPBP family intramembrane metalloprotease [candidate division KSB3 bacterium]
MNPRTPPSGKRSITARGNCSNNRGSMKRILHFLTIEQWQQIDRMYLREAPRRDIDGRILSVCLIFPCVLIAIIYFGKYPTFVRLFGETFQTWPYPHLYSHLYWALFRVGSYFLLPALVVTCLFRERLQTYGLRIDRHPKVLVLYAAMLGAMIPLVVIVSHSPAFLRTYPFYDQAANSWTELVVWEVAYALQFFALEFFFRGFILFAFARYIGAYAIFMIAIPYTMIHFQKPLPETLGAIIAGLALGTLALRTRSIFGGVFLHIAVAWSMDLLALAQKGQLHQLVEH